MLKKIQSAKNTYPCIKIVAVRTFESSQNAIHTDPKSIVKDSLVGIFKILQGAIQSITIIDKELLVAPLTVRSPRYL